jgi:radical SAM protein with 4Fe4S-binding SPASM domain
MERLPVRSVNLGTGENGMHPEFKAILAYLRTKPVKLTITSNGHSVAVLKDDDLRAFHDIEFSLDYPTQKEQDAQRGEGNWELIEQQARRCVNLGVPVTIIAVMMKANYLRLAEVAGVAKKFDAPLRINVYQAVRSDVYALTYEEYWEGFRRLLAATDVIAIGEPLVRAMAGLPPLQGGCGVSTVRVTPRATTQPCVYWPGRGEPLSYLISAGADILNSTPFAQTRTLPDACQPCEFRESCHGGCAGRSAVRQVLRNPTVDRRPGGAGPCRRSARVRRLLFNQFGVSDVQEHEGGDATGPGFWLGQRAAVGGCCARHGALVEHERQHRPDREGSLQQGRACQ